MTGLLAAVRRSAVFACIGIAHAGAVFAEGNEYLKYQEPPSSGSVLSSLDSVLYLLVMFAFILGLAYLTSRFIGARMQTQPRGADGDAVLRSLALGPNKGMYLVRFAGRLMLLGVSEQRIELLADLTDAPDAAELLAGSPLQSAVMPQFAAVFDSQLASLRQMSGRFPHIFGGDAADSPAKREREKR
ncbi:MAG: flagellar biosynthetic protein FliO [Sporomusaceae bacterium]|nr:flagellar biosynthetic protein FliO [Sporomusaceae bacterium]